MIQKFLVRDQPTIRLSQGVVVGLPGAELVAAIAHLLIFQALIIGLSVQAALRLVGSPHAVMRMCADTR